jgi:pyruvate kinase
MRTQIIATIGPSSSTKEIIEALIIEGMDIARFNFSHGTHETAAKWIGMVREAALRIGRPVRILQDLQGPRIRVGELPEEGIKLEDDALVDFSTMGGNNGIFIDHEKLHLDARVGEPMYLANGEMELVVEKIEGDRITTRVIRGGILRSRKGVNLPRTKLSNSGLTKKDIADVKFGLAQGVDMIAISFVQSADDVHALREIVGDKAKIIAKIETALAVEHMNSISRASDGIMIARGDLGIEMPIEKLPLVQKNLIRHARWYGRGTVTATQMLLSMVDHAHPTRAEVSDVANAVWDGTDAVMLSDETANGKYPVESVRMMVKIVREVEAAIFEHPNPLAA